MKNVVNYKESMLNNIKIDKKALIAAVSTFVATMAVTTSAKCIKNKVAERKKNKFDAFLANVITHLELSTQPKISLLYYIIAKHGNFDERIVYDEQHTICDEVFYEDDYDTFITFSAADYLNEVNADIFEQAFRQKEEALNRCRTFLKDNPFIGHRLYKKYDLHNIISDYVALHTHKYFVRVLCKSRTNDILSKEIIVTLNDLKEYKEAICNE